MPLPSETSDTAILDLLRQGGAGIAELTTATKVTATAVRQRLNRLMSQGLIERHAAQAGRGRPSHRYRLTKKGERRGGTNFSDLALVLWEELRSIPDPEVRRGLLGRMARQMAGMYAERIEGDSTVERMQSVAGLFAERNVPFLVTAGSESDPGEGVPGDGTNSNSARTSSDPSARLPVLTALACPYPELAEQDRGICAMERMMLSELLEQNVKLSACRLDGDSCCQFQTTAAKSN